MADMQPDVTSKSGRRPRGRGGARANGNDAAGHSNTAGGAVVSSKKPGRRPTQQHQQSAPVDLQKTTPKGVRDAQSSAGRGARNRDKRKAESVQDGAESKHLELEQKKQHPSAEDNKNHREVLDQFDGDGAKSAEQDASKGSAKTRTGRGKERRRKGKAGTDAEPSGTEEAAETTPATQAATNVRKSERKGKSKNQRPESDGVEDVKADAGPDVSTDVANSVVEPPPERTQLSEKLVELLRAVEGPGEGPGAAEAGATAALAQVHPCLVVIHKRVRACRKKMTRIEGIEKMIAAGQTVNDEQKQVFAAKLPNLQQLAELEKVQTLMEEAVAEDAAKRRSLAGDLTAEAQLLVTTVDEWKDKAHAHKQAARKQELASSKVQSALDKEVARHSSAKTEVDELRKELKTMKSSLSATREELSETRRSADEMKEKIASLQTQNGALETELAAAKAALPEAIEAILNLFVAARMFDRLPRSEIPQVLQQLQDMPKQASSSEAQVTFTSTDISTVQYAHALMGGAENPYESMEQPAVCVERHVRAARGYVERSASEVTAGVSYDRLYRLVQAIARSSVFHTVHSPPAAQRLPDQHRQSPPQHQHQQHQQSHQQQPHQQQHHHGLSEAHLGHSFSPSVEASSHNNGVVSAPRAAAMDFIAHAGLTVRGSEHQDHQQRAIRGSPGHGAGEDKAAIRALSTSSTLTQSVPPSSTLFSHSEATTPVAAEASSSADAYLGADVDEVNDGLQSQDQQYDYAPEEEDYAHDESPDQHGYERDPSYGDGYHPYTGAYAYGPYGFQPPGVPFVQGYDTPQPAISPALPPSSSGPLVPMYNDHMGNYDPAAYGVGQPMYPLEPPHARRGSRSQGPPYLTSAHTQQRPQAHFAQAQYYNGHAYPQGPQVGVQEPEDAAPHPDTAPHQGSIPGPDSADDVHSHSLFQNRSSNNNSSSGSREPEQWYGARAQAYRTESGPATSPNPQPPETHKDAVATKQSVPSSETPRPSRAPMRRRTAAFPDQSSPPSQPQAQPQAQAQAQPQPQAHRAQDVPAASESKDPAPAKVEAVAVAQAAPQSAEPSTANSRRVRGRGGKRGRGRGRGRGA